MIPQEWQPHHRQDDGELLGYLVPTGVGRCVPVTPFGHPLGPAQPSDDAARLLDESGLSYLADRWYLRVDGRDDPIAVRIAEVAPDRMTVRNADYGYEGNIGDPFVLMVPTDRLTRT